MAHRYLIGQEVMYALSVGQLKAILATKDDSIPVVIYQLPGAERVAPPKTTNVEDVYFSGPNVLAVVMSGSEPAPGEPIQEALIIYVGSPNYNPPIAPTDAPTG